MKKNRMSKDEAKLKHLHKRLLKLDNAVEETEILVKKLEFILKLKQELNMPAKEIAKTQNLIIKALLTKRAILLEQASVIISIMELEKEVLPRMK